MDNDHKKCTYRNGIRAAGAGLLAAMILWAGIPWPSFFNERITLIPTADASTVPQPVLVVGDDVNYPPYSFLDANGNPTGFNVELARAVGEAMGYQVEIRLDEWSRTRQALENGEIDVISGMFYSPEREDTYSFSARHSVTNGDIFTRQETQVTELEDLRDQEVVVQRGDIVGEYLAGLDLNIRLVEVSTVNEALHLIRTGVHDYAGILKMPGLYSIRENNFKNLKAQNLNLMPMDYSMVVAKGNERLLLTLNGGLQVVMATGQFDEIFDHWLGTFEETSPWKTILEYRWVILAAVMVVLVLLAAVLILRFLVKKRTRELEEANRDLHENQEELKALNMEMEAAMEELVAMEQEARDQFDQLRVSDQKLKATEEQNRAIIQAMPDVLFTFDDEARFLDCQTNAMVPLYLPKDAFLGQKAADVLPAEMADRLAEKIGEALLTESVQRYEYQLSIAGERKVFEMRLVKAREKEVIGFTRDITAERMYQEKIEYLSYHDQLTGLYNRRFFEAELSRLDVARNLPLCIIMADVNGLKLINDSFGHKMGDQLLVKVGEVLQEACRADEIISRIGGDEFVILIPGMESGEAEQLVKRITGICEDEKVGSLDLSISFGWEVKRLEEEDIHEVFNRAEDYMYKKKLFEGPSMRGKTIGAIINTLHEKNKREEAHSQRVSDLCVEMGRAINLPERELDEMRTVGLLHDIGKIAINEEILNKPGRLTEEEYEEIKRHPEIGYRILSSVNDMQDMAAHVLSHHERWDGGGYPRGLAGEAIPVQSRMIAIADAFDAMTGERTYRPSLTEEEALKELVKHAGTQFDPALVDVFTRRRNS